MTDKELMQMALDALEHLQTDIEWQYKSPTRAMLRKVEKALRAALAQPEQLPSGDSAPQQEPVVWMYQDKSTNEVRFQKHMRAFVDHGAVYEVPLYTTPPDRDWETESPEGS